MVRHHRTGQPKLRLTPPMKLIFATAQKQRTAYQHRTLGLNHWITALRELFPILPGKAAWDDIKLMDIRTALKEGDVGPVLSKKRVIEEAIRLAKTEQLPSPTAYELVRVVVGKMKALAPKYGELMPTAGDGFAGADGPRAEPVAEAPPARAASATPTLDEFGRDLTSEAESGLLCQIVGRSEQVALMIESLCRTTKRNIALIGPAGVGKRGLVECLASRIKDNGVPEALKGIRVVEVHFVAIIAGVTGFEELGKRVGAIVAEAKNPKIVLFFDDLRAVMAAGVEGPGAAIAGQLKPDLVQGSITCIVSGSEEDYRRITAVDPTWHHWFQPIRVDELDRDEALQALDAIAEHVAARGGVNVPKPVRKWIVDFADEFLKSHHFPGKAADLLEQAMARAVSEGAKKVTLRHAHAVAERAIGVPTEMHTRLGRVASALADTGILVDADRKRLEERLSVTLRSLDLRPERPNAVILLAGETAAWAHALAESLALGIAGSAERVIGIDLSPFDEPWDLRRLVGPFEAKPPTREAHALMRLLDSPWSVVLFENIDGCHAHVRSTITRALEAGYFTDATGRKIHLSDTIVVFTAPTLASKRRSQLGFAEGAERPVDASKDASAVLGREFAELLDLVVTEVKAELPPPSATRQRLFDDLARRYRTRGLKITWDQTLTDWFEAEVQQRRSQDEWDEWVDRELAAALIPHLPDKPSDAIKQVTVGRARGGLIVDAATHVAR